MLIFVIKHLKKEEETGGSDPIPKKNSPQLVYSGIILYTIKIYDTFAIKKHSKLKYSDLLGEDCAFAQNRESKVDTIKC